MILMLLRGLLGWCPYCGKGRLAKYPISMHRFCDNCGLEFENAPGDFTGGAVPGYGITSVASLALGFAIYFLWEPPIALVIVIGVVFIILMGIITYLPMKGLWIAFLVYTHALTPPGMEDWS
jgi:uncharacterized protein (DUF983 family)